MPEYVRVKDTSTGHEYTVAEEAVVEGQTVLKKDAVDRLGEPLPAKPKVSVTPSGGGKSGSDAEPKEK